jgi:undecaprenyl-diphosphatase
MHALVTFIGQYLIIVPFAGLIVVFWRLEKARRKQFLLTVILAAILAYGIAKIGRALFYDPRPFVAGHFTPYFGHSTDNGFPSDHTLFASFAGFIAYLYSKRLGIALLVVAVLIGGARVVAGVHHGVDIVGAFAASLIGILIARAVIAQLAKK